MALMGKVRELWRYPVKSMAGERLERGAVGPMGVLGDRGWAVRDEKVKEIRGAKKLPELMRCAARYVAEPSAAKVAAAEITMPDGTRVMSDDPEAGALLSRLLGRPVSLWPLQPADAKEHYRRAQPDNPDFTEEVRQMFGRLKDEPLPDLSVFPPELMEYASPLGTYFDAFPLHILTTASLAELGRLNPGSRFDVRRFRPNILVETAEGLAGLVEAAWLGKTIRVGAMRARVEVPCVRCVMVTLPQAGLEKDPGVLRTIVREASQNAGVYASVIAPGRVAVDDEVEIL